MAFKKQLFGLLLILRMAQLTANDADYNIKKFHYYILKQ